MPRILLVHSKPEEAGKHAAVLRKKGHVVRVLRPGGIADRRALRARRPDADSTWSGLCFARRKAR